MNKQTKGSSLLIHIITGTTKLGPKVTLSSSGDSLEGQGFTAFKYLFSYVILHGTIFAGLFSFINYQIISS